MKKVIKYAVLNENQYNGSEGYDIHQLADDIVFEDIYYTLFDYISDRCDNIDIEKLENGDIRVGTDYYIFLSERYVA
jgi:hypothetical protein